MKKKIMLGSLLFVLVALISIGVTPSAAGQADERLITVLNPAISSRMTERIPLTPRTGTLEGKTVYMVDLQWGGPKAAYSVFEEIQDWFSRNMPSVKTEIRRSKGGPFGDDPGLRAEIISKKAGGVIIGIAG
jgi:hypothetical protein